MCCSLAALALASVVAAADAAPAAPAKVALQPLDCRWTFGNHEPIAMYRRAGGKTTGGLEGSALWLEQWHHWFDSEASTQLMQELGLNFLHCRFYKGLGWEHEVHDFPNVQRFVEHCHRHGVRALAYIQFSTLYYETLLNEVPGLADWVALDEQGRKRTWHGAYYRWVPCNNHPDFEAYLKKMIRIALEDGGFDGVMFDNCDMPPCYCPRCVDLFRAHLAGLGDPRPRFGLPTLAHVLPPVPPAGKFGELQDPLAQEWVRFRCQRMTDLCRRLFAHTKQCKASAIFSGNIQNIRRGDIARKAALDMPELADCFDLFVSQSGNAPGMQGDCIVNRVREMKLAAALRTPILALCDSDAGGAAGEDVQCDALALVEDAVFGGIPTDRTVLKPDPQMVSPQRLAAHRALLGRFDRAVRAGRPGLEAPSYAPVRVLYAREALMLSEQSYAAVLATEEILLRHHVPYGLLPTAAAAPLTIPTDCAVLVVPDQRALADAQIEALVKFARVGGRMIVTGQSGRYDGDYRQRRDNPLAQALAELPNVVVRETVDAAPIKGSGWTIKVGPPSQDGRRLLADLARLWSPPVRIVAPPTVFAEVKRSPAGLYVHLVNYAGPAPAQDVRVELAAEQLRPGPCTVAVPMEERPATTVATGQSPGEVLAIPVPAFVAYAVVSVPTAARGTPPSRPKSSTK